jgi:hypothetical protein
VQKVANTDSDSLDDSMHNLEARIPRKKRVSMKNVCWNLKGEVVDIKNSDLEDDRKMPAKISY